MIATPVSDVRRTSLCVKCFLAASPASPAEGVAAKAREEAQLGDGGGGEGLRLRVTSEEEKNGLTERIRCYRKQRKGEKTDSS